MREKESYGDKKFWNEYWKMEKREENQFIFSDIINKYISWNKVKRYMEIGGAPGSIMSYMNKSHNLEVSTIDFCDKNIIVDFLNKSGVEKYNVYCEDFFEFDVESFKKRYDIVASWGVVEHFSLDKVTTVISKQKKLVDEEGYLIVELPNIRYFNWWLYYIVNRNLLEIHNLKIMDLEFLKNEIIKEGFEIIYGDYYLTSFLQYNDSNAFFEKHLIIGKLFRFANKLMKILRINNIPNRIFSPYILFIAKKI